MQKKLIRKITAYVCICSGDKFREYSKEKKKLSLQKLSVKENLERWKNMFDKKIYKVGGAVFEI